ncbi:MAG: PepSY domain-containing protein [Acidimicrobiales bacterium]|nr:PepSY domain-containing protein [Acidimicrobiales bacterium]
MSIKDRSTRIAAGGAAALGLTLGVAGLAGAATSPDQTASPAPAVEEDQTQDPILNGSIQSPEDESLSEADEAKALEGLATIAASDAEHAALAANPGATVNSSELGNENGSVVYEVDLTDASGADVEVKVDAGNGDILSQENDDDGNEADEGDEGSASGADEANEAAEVTPNG